MRLSGADERHSRRLRLRVHSRASPRGGLGGANVRETARRQGRRAQGLDHRRCRGRAGPPRQSDHGEAGPGGHPGSPRRGRANHVLGPCSARRHAIGLRPVDVDDPRLHRRPRDGSRRREGRTVYHRHAAQPRGAPAPDGGDPRDPRRQGVPFLGRLRGRSRFTRPGVSRNARRFRDDVDAGGEPSRAYRDAGRTPTARRRHARRRPCARHGPGGEGRRPPRTRPRIHNARGRRRISGPARRRAARVDLGRRRFLGRLRRSPSGNAPVGSGRRPVLRARAGDREEPDRRPHGHRRLHRIPRRTWSKKRTATPPSTSP